MQRRMLAVLLQVRPYPYEEVGAFVRRRGRAATKLQGDMGRWNDLYVAKLASWAAHVDRRPQGHRVKRLLAVQSREWLSERRARHAGGDVFRTETRLRGPVHRRWDMGIIAASSRGMHSG